MNRIDVLFNNLLRETCFSVPGTVKDRVMFVMLLHRCTVFILMSLF